MRFRLGNRKFLYLAVLLFVLFLTFNNIALNLEQEMLIGKIHEKNLSLLEAYDPAVVSIVRDSYLIPPSKLPYNLSTDIIYQARSTSFHWGVINQLVEQFFSDEPPGFFIEAGALDGEFLSNTLWLEETMGWSGFLVEPEPNNYEELVNKRRKAWISNSCLSNTTRPMHIDMVATRKKESEPLDPMAIRGGAHFAGAHDNDESYIKFENEKLITTKFKAQCFPLYSYLLALDVKKVDFLSLDLQGPEISIFMTLPVDNIYIRAVVLEHESFSEGIDFKLIKEMDKKGFTIVAVGGSPDYFFINSHDDRLMSKLNYLLKNAKTEGVTKQLLNKKSKDQRQ